MSSTRLDLEIVNRGLASSRSRAQEYIANGMVFIDGAVARKTSQKVKVEHDITIAKPEKEWVSRAAEKLIAGLNAFPCEIPGKIAIDVGASTGGFTEVLLHEGAQKVYAVDVGTEQLHPSLRNHPGIINLENQNARELNAEIIPDPIDIVVSDVSFISLKKALPASMGLCRPGAMLIALIKPQFEVGRANIGKGGIVRDPEIAEQCRLDSIQWINIQPGWTCLGTIESPVKGSDGNQEYLMGARLDA